MKVNPAILALAAVIGGVAGCVNDAGPKKQVISVPVHVRQDTTPEMTVAACTRAIGAGGGDSMAKAYLARGDAYAVIGDYQYAERDFQQAIETAPKDIEARLAAIRFWRGMKENEKAYQGYNEALVLAPDDVRLLRGRGTLNAIERKFDAALKDINAAIRLAPRDAQSYIARSYLYLEQDQPEPALAAIEAALKLDPNSYIAYFNRGAAHAMQNDNDAALADYDKAVELNPTTMRGALARGHFFMKMNRFDLAAKENRRSGSNDQWLWTDESGMLYVYLD